MFYVVHIFLPLPLHKKQIWQTKASYPKRTYISVVIPEPLGPTTPI
ncbi:hypothetical protein OMAG_002476 [Candidatus Omnitrophus magneticus]|uniref:Uncharacterized protein n=1 Tax=Candidatus Omnitrophus magneticus TaxID=1609969 RepID=A0A0F0CK83_9BACT|nr:hypothetical protein OMAG_002476 [Candidatus Omnitrophus magneticus]